MKKRHERQQYWKEHYKAFKKSGLTQRAYCRKNDLGYWSFGQWKRRFEKNDPDTSIQQIPVKYKPESSPEDRIEVVLENRLKIFIPNNSSPETLKNILAVLGELS